MPSAAEQALGFLLLALQADLRLRRPAILRPACSWRRTSPSAPNISLNALFPVRNRSPGRSRPTITPPWQEVREWRRFGHARMCGATCLCPGHRAVFQERPPAVSMKRDDLRQPFAPQQYRRRRRAGRPACAWCRASITSRSAPTYGARSVLLMTSRSERVMPGPPLRGIFSPPADVDHVDRQVGEIGREGRGEVVAAGFDEDRRRGRGSAAASRRSPRG